MPYLADCYVLTPRRDPALVEAFLAEFLPGGAVEAASEYPVPWLSVRPTHVFSSLGDLLSYLANHRDVPYAVYWHPRATLTTQIKGVSVHCTSDSATILSVSCPADAREEDLFTRLKHFAGSTNGYITYEQPPPETSAEFLALVAETRRQP